MKQKNTLIGLLLLILILSITIGHFFPPGGILFSPIVVSLMTGIIVFTNNGFNILIKSIISYVFIGINDIAIKLFSGGIHDMEGIGWINMLLLIGLIPSFIMLLIVVIRNKESTNWFKVTSILVFIVLICLHLKIFETLGAH